MLHVSKVELFISQALLSTLLVYQIHCITRDKKKSLVFVCLLDSASPRINKIHTKTLLFIVVSPVMQKTIPSKPGFDVLRHK